MSVAGSEGSRRSRRAGSVAVTAVSEPRFSFRMKGTNAASKAERAADPTAGMARGVFKDAAEKLRDIQDDHGDPGEAAALIPVVREALASVSLVCDCDALRHTEAGRARLRKLVEANRAVAVAVEHVAQPRDLHTRMHATVEM